MEDGKQSELEAMCRDWPFFHASWDAEMQPSKADLRLADLLRSASVAKTLAAGQRATRPAGSAADIKVVLAIANDSHLMADFNVIAESIQLRNVYTDPLQAELLHRVPV